MQNKPEIHYLSVSELAQDIENVTGQKEYAQSVSMRYAISYRDEIIDTVRYRRGIIDERAIRLNRHIRWEHTRCHSQKLTANMLAAGRSKPADTSAHHIVAWNHPRAIRSRIRLAAFGIDIDNEANGVFLPKGLKCCPHPILPAASPHTKVHTHFYFLNVEFLLESTIAEGMGRNDIIETLREIGEDLQDGVFPITEGLESA